MKSISQLFSGEQQMVNIRKYQVYVLIAFLASVVILLITPPNQVPDEFAHFIRAIDISKGQLIPDRQPVFIPKVFEDLQQIKAVYSLDDQQALFSLKLNGQEGRGFVSSSNYPFPIYLPQGLGIALGSLLRLPPFGIFLLGRFFNALAFCIVILLALRIMPGKKWLLLMLFCSPMALYEAGSYSPDALTNAWALFFISLVFSLSQNDTLLRKDQWIGLMISTWLLALCKINIVPLAMLLFIIPCQRFGGMRKKIAFLVSGLLLIFITLLTWNLVTSLGGAIEDVKPKEQLLYVILYPINFFSTLLNTFADTWRFYLTTWFGTFGWLDTPLPQLALLVYVIVLTFLAGLKDDGFKINDLAKWMTGFSFVFSLVLTFGILYLVWTPYQAGTIQGVQGRYLIPLVPLLFIIIPPFLKSFPSLNRFQGLAAWIVSVSLWSLTVAVLILRFYITCGSSFYSLTACSLPAEDWMGEPVQLEPIVAGHVVEQEFVAECNQLHRIRLSVSTYDRSNPSSLQITLIEKETQIVVKEFEVDNRYIDQEKGIFLPFDPIDDTKGKIMVIRIESDANADNAVTLNRTNGDQYPSGQLTVDGIPLDGDLMFEYGCKIGLE